MRRALLAGALIAAGVLAACGPSQDATPAAPTAPADAPSTPASAAPDTAAADYTRPINALGTEPFWSLKIRPGSLVFSAPDTGDITVTGPASILNVRRATWVGTGSDGNRVSAILTPGPCSDGMSDAVHPFTAVVEAGGRSLKGCAAYADATPKPN